MRKNHKLPLPSRGSGNGSENSEDFQIGDNPQKIFSQEVEAQIIGMQSIRRKAVFLMRDKRKTIDQLDLRKDGAISADFFEHLGKRSASRDSRFAVDSPKRKDHKDRKIRIITDQILEKSGDIVSEFLFWGSGPVICSVCDCDQIGLNGIRLERQFRRKNFSADRLVDDFRIQRFRELIRIG